MVRVQVVFSTQMSQGAFLAWLGEHGAPVESVQFFDPETETDRIEALLGADAEWSGPVTRKGNPGWHRHQNGGYHEDHEGVLNVQGGGHGHRFVDGALGPPQPLALDGGSLR